MIKFLHKINDKVFFRSIILILILWNLKYFILPVQVIYSAITQDFLNGNEFYSSVNEIKSEISNYSDFFDEGKIGFVSDINQGSVFDKVESIKAFYIAQYAVIPAVMKNDTDENYLIGAFFRKEAVPNGFSVTKKLRSNLYLLKKENN